MWVQQEHEDETVGWLPFLLEGLTEGARLGSQAYLPS